MSNILKRHGIRFTFPHLKEREPKYKIGEYIHYYSFGWENTEILGIKKHKLFGWTWLIRYNINYAAPNHKSELILNHHQRKYNKTYRVRNAPEAVIVNRKNIEGKW